MIENRKLNPLGFGGWQLGSDETWGNMNKQDGVNLVQEAFQQGINFFDTAPGYSSGRSETIIGEALRGVRDEVFINTKLGHKADGSSDFSVENLERNLQESLSRLQTTYLDSVLLHNPSFEILKGKTKHFAELQRLKEKGLIHHYGVSIDQVHELEATLEHTNCDVIELLFNVFFQSTRELLEKVKKRNIKLIIKVPLDSGWLTGKYDETSTFSGVRSRWNKQDIQRRSGLIKQLKEIVHDEELTKYALGFVYSFDAITCVIPGIKNSDQLHEHLEFQHYQLPNELKQKFIDLYEQEIRKNPLPW